MRLYGTPPSHFTRKVRIVLQELGLPYEFVRFTDLLAVGPDNFAHNPLHHFPVLEHEGLRLIESDLICQYLIKTYGRGKELSSLFPSAENETRDGQTLAMINGGMAAGVVLLRAQRSGLKNLDSVPFFQQERAGLDGSQRWLEQDLAGRTTYYPGRFTYLDVALLCFLEWAAFREFLLPEKEIPGLVKFVRTHESRASARATHPSKSEVTQ
ncbi:MAG TPA: glutathione S-transferase family protein [Bdellovibrionota bacterium]|jgi:glutathione S-transferase